MGHRYSNRKNVINDIPNLGFSGEHLLRPLFMDHEWRPYEGGVIFVDPSGRGKDETAWAVMKVLNGILYLLKVGHEVTDPTKAMAETAQDARCFNISMIEVEPNFGQGMWVAAFQPILTKIWKGGATVQASEWAKGQKEVRIIDTPSRCSRSTAWWSLRASCERTLLPRTGTTRFSTSSPTSPATAGR